MLALPSHSPWMLLACIVIIVDFPVFLGLVVNRLPSVAPLFQRGDRGRWGIFWSTNVTASWLVALIVVTSILLTGSNMAAIALVPPPWLELLAALVLLALFVLFALRTSTGSTIIPPDMTGMRAILPHTRRERLVWLLLICPSTAICEELAYRGFLLAFLNALIGFVPGLVVQAMISGFQHGGYKQSFTAFGARTLLGILCAMLTLWTGNLLLAIILHFTCDAFFAILPSVPARLPIIRRQPTGALW